jgi:phosphatidylglycerophosphate synthase
MTINARQRDLVARYLRPVGEGLARIGVTANGLTLVGLVLALVAAAMIVVERPLTAGLLLAGAGIADLLDGSVARARGGATRLGGFYDSVADRLADGAVLAAIAWWLRDDPVLFAAAAAALITAEVTSYVRAKAEAMGVRCTVGLIERAERTIIIVAGLVFHRWLLAIALGVLALGGAYTVWERVRHVVPQLRGTDVEGPETP